jgi:hypothetical protein
LDIECYIQHYFFLDYKISGGVLSLGIPKIFSMCKVMERSCPKCGRDYSNNPYWTTDLRKHLLRKNQCDRTPDTKYIRGTIVPLREIFSLDSSIMNITEVPYRDDMLEWFFGEFTKNQKNVCFVKPNKSKNEILVKVNGCLKIVTISEFIKLFFNLVIIKWFPENPDFETKLICDLQYDLDTREPWNGVYTFEEPKKDGTMKIVISEFYTEIKRIILNYMHMYPDKTGLKNLLTLSSNGNDES